MEKQQFRKFGVRDQIGYMLGDVGGSFVNLFISSFFILFCTYVLGVSPYFMGTMFLFGKFYDAIITAIMGTLPDRYKLGKSGDKFKPWIRFSMWFLAASCILSFIDVSSWSSAAIHVWVVFVYLFFCTAYTADAIPYGSLASVISNDPIERTKLSRARSIGGLIVGAGFLSFVPMFIYDKSGSIVPEAFFYIAIVFSILSVLSYMVLLALTVERVRTDKPDEESTVKKNTDYSFKEAAKAAFSNRPMVGLMVATLGSTLLLGLMSLATLVFAEHYDNPGAFAINMFAMMGLTFALFGFIPSLAKKFGKRNLIIWSNSFSLVAFILLTIFPIENVWVFIGLYNIANLGSIAFTMIIWALVTDAIDYGEYQTGKSYEGTLYSLYSFARKVGMGIGAAVGSYALGWAGFVSDAKQQTDEVARNLVELYTGIPIVGFVVVLIGIIFIYNLNEKRTTEMYETLKERRAIKL